MMVTKNKFSASETKLHEPANEEGLLYFTECMQFVNVAQWFMK
jgi:hypothetical protein